MNLRSHRKLVHRLFEIGVIAKAVDGALEIIGGVALFLVNPDQINGIVRLLTQHELSEDPRDVIAGFLARSVEHLSADTKAFAAIFLLWHGAVKLGLVVGLLRHKLWAYPIAIVAFGAFVAYQFYRYTLTHSVWLIALSVLDLFVIVLALLEYTRLRGEFAEHRTDSAPKRR